MTSKYETLRTLGDHMPVPPLTALNEIDFAIIWDGFTQRAIDIAAVLRTVQLTAGAFLDDHIARIDALAAMPWSDAADAHLQQRLHGAGFTEHSALAVRSSASVEDGVSQSFAGIFATQLDVTGLDAIKAAIRDVWVSGISRAAIVERIRAGNAGMSVGMTAILQEMVAARFAGVAFSHDPLTGDPIVTIETVASLGDAIVSGSMKGSTARLADGTLECAPEMREQEPLLRAVASLATRAAAALGGPADIEWAADPHQLWLLQARPITTVRRDERVDPGPQLSWVPLYRSDDDALIPFRPLPGFAQYFRSKRKPLADFALAHGVSAGAALLVQANAAGFADESARTRLLAEFSTPEVVLDFSDSVRQQILPRDALSTRIAELIGNGMSDRRGSDTRAANRLHCFVIREFLSGDSGLITVACEDDSTTCEWSSEGLLAINRGIASTRSAQLHAGTDEHAVAALPDAALLHRATHEATRAFGTIQLEWVRCGQRLHLIDFSPLAASLARSDTAGMRVISPGFADGVPVVVGTDRHLEEISISATVSINAIPSAESLGTTLQQLERQLQAHHGQAIVVSPRPYAALAALLPHARGFVFEQASLLCHLSILLREHGVPAVESAELYRVGVAGQRITFSGTAGSGPSVISGEHTLSSSAEIRHVN